MKEDITLCVGIPTINRADLLDEALQVYSETFYGRHQFILDNGNQDIKTYSGDQQVMTMQKNLGVSGSWNLLCKRAILKGYTHIALLNDDIVWKKNADEIEDYIQNHPSDFYQGLGTWCCFVLPLSTFNEVGRFDELFYPAYYEDNSYAYRLKLANKKVKADAFFNPDVYRNSQTIAKDPSLNSKFHLNKEMYIKMWGGLPNDEKFTKPFNGENDYDPNTYIHHDSL